MLSEMRKIDFMSALGARFLIDLKCNPRRN